MEQLEYNLLFRWFVGLNMDDAVWDATVFTKNRERLLAGDIAQEFFSAMLTQARESRFMSDEHFTVDGKLVEAWAGQKSFRKKGKKPPRVGGEIPRWIFAGRSGATKTHEATTDPEAKLFKKAPGNKAQLCYLGHALMDNKNPLVVNALVSQATGTAERNCALAMCDAIPGSHRITVGAVKAYDSKECVTLSREQKITPHVGQKEVGSAIDGRRHRGVARVGWMFTFTAALPSSLRKSPEIYWQGNLTFTSFSIS